MFFQKAVVTKHPLYFPPLSCRSEEWGASRLNHSQAKGKKENKKNQDRRRRHISLEMQGNTHGFVNLQSSNYSNGSQTFS